MFQFLVALGKMFGGFERNSLCEEFCTPFNSKTCKYSQPSFKMELLHNCVLTNKNVIQWNVINYMKEFIVLYYNNKY